MAGTDIHKATGIIISNRKVLFTREHGSKYFIDPGGKIEPGETAKQALIRELREELSVDVNEAALEPFGEYVGEAGPGRAFHMQAFMVSKWHGEIKPGTEVEEFRWLDAELSANVIRESIFVSKVIPELINRGIIGQGS